MVATGRSLERPDSPKLEDKYCAICRGGPIATCARWQKLGDMVDTSRITFDKDGFAISPAIWCSHRQLEAVFAMAQFAKRHDLNICQFCRIILNIPHTMGTDQSGNIQHEFELVVHDAIVEGTHQYAAYTTDELRLLIAQYMYSAPSTKKTRLKPLATTLRPTLATNSQDACKGPSFPRGLPITQQQHNTRPRAAVPVVLVLPVDLGPRGAPTALSTVGYGGMLDDDSDVGVPPTPMGDQRPQFFRRNRGVGDEDENGYERMGCSRRERDIAVAHDPPYDGPKFRID